MFASRLAPRQAKERQECLVLPSGFGSEADRGCRAGLLMASLAARHQCSRPGPWRPVGCPELVAAGGAQPITMSEAVPFSSARAVRVRSDSLTMLVRDPSAAWAQRRMADMRERDERPWPGN